MPNSNCSGMKDNDTNNNITQPQKRQNNQQDNKFIESFRINKNEIKISTVSENINSCHNRPKDLIDYSDGLISDNEKSLVSIVTKAVKTESNCNLLQLNIIDPINNNNNNNNSNNNSDSNFIITNTHDHIFDFKPKVSKQWASDSCIFDENEITTLKNVWKKAGDKELGLEVMIKLFLN
jgi:hypothetical protein